MLKALSLAALLAVSSPAFSEPNIEVDNPHKYAAIVNYDEHDFKTFDNRAPSLEEVQKAIRAAATLRGWTVKPGDPGHIMATLIVRNYHTAMVDIAYDQQHFAIRYKNSVNLNYGHGYTRPVVGEHGQITHDETEIIHPKYNEWVGELKDTILLELTN
jgi:hypothetical protein